MAALLCCAALLAAQRRAVAQPSNNNCFSCTPISPGQALDLVPSGATLDGSSSCPLVGDFTCVLQGVGDVWYCITPCCPQPITITVSLPPLTDPVVVSVHTDCPGTTANQIVCNAGTLTPGVSVSFTPSPGQTYYIRVAYFLGTCLPVNFVVSASQTVAAPVNNACNPGTTLSGTVTDLPFTTCGATTDGPGGACTGFNDIWYNYSASTCGYVTVSANTTSTVGTCGMDPCIGIFCPGCPAGGLIACSHNTAYTCLLPPNGFASVRFYAVPGRQYKIRLGSVANNTTGSGTLSISFAPALPANDVCATATPLAANQFIYGSTTCANPSPIEFALCTPGTNNSPDVWYSFSPACSGTYTVLSCEGAQCGPSFDTLLAVFSGCPSSDLGSAIACNNDACGAQSIVTFTAVACQTYYIRVAGATLPAFGDFSLVISGPTGPLPPAPPNNACAAATVVGAGTYAFNTCNATLDGPFSEPVSMDIWYRYTPACSGVVTLSTCGSPIASDTSLAVYTGACGSLSLVGFNDNPVAPCFPGDLVPACLGSVQSYLRFSATAGTPYLIRVGSSIPGNFVCGRLNIVGPNPTTPTCPPGGTSVMTRVFRVLGPSNNTPWSWCLSKACCFSIQNLNVPGEPVTSPDLTSRYLLATRFANSIRAACPPSVNLRIFSFRDLIFVQARCPSVTPASQLVLSVGSVNTLCTAQCVVSGTSLNTNGQLCSFNPPIEEVPLSGMDCNANGEDDLTDVIVGTSADVNFDLIPDECQTFCLCDLNGSGTVTSQDFFDFLSGFFNGTLDYNHDGIVTSQDYFDFLTCFFVRPPGCH
ncbi:MAG: hypothetical protein AB7G11_15945 [Phycisphaerales bacterium]